MTPGHAPLGAQVYVACIVLAAAALGAGGRAGFDLLGGLIWLALAWGRVLPPKQLLAGFGNQAVVLVASMMAVAEALRQVGLGDAFGRWLTDRAGGDERRALPLFAAAAACLGALLESTAAVVALVPIAARLGSRGTLRPRRVYLVIALGAMAGGLLTLVGTSANLVANGVLRGLGLPPFGFLELTPLGLVMLAGALLYSLTLGRALLPRPGGVMLDQAVQALRAYTAEVRVEPGFPWVGARLRDAEGLRTAGIDVLAIQRGGRLHEDPGADERLLPGDLLTVMGGATGVAGLTALGAGEVAPAIVEGLLPPGSPWVGSTLADIGARASGLRVLGIWRHGETLAGGLADVPLRAGDVLLARGDRTALVRFQVDGSVAWLNEVPVGERPPARGRAWLGLGVLAAFVAVAASGSFDLAAAAFTAAVVLASCGCLPGRTAYGAIEWKVVLLLSGVIPLGEAISRTGLAARIAGWLAEAVHPVGPWASLPLLFVVAAALTQVLSNVATAGVLTPVAVRLAAATGLDPKSCVAAVLVGVMCTPLTPLASKPTLLVHDPGGYVTRDYLRFGIPFAVLALAAAALLPPHLWPAR